MSSIGEACTEESRVCVRLFTHEMSLIYNIIVKKVGSIEKLQQISHGIPLN